MNTDTGAERVLSSRNSVGHLYNVDPGRYIITDIWADPGGFGSFDMCVTCQFMTGLVIGIAMVPILISIPFIVVASATYRAITDHYKDGEDIEAMAYAEFYVMPNSITYVGTLHIYSIGRNENRIIRFVDDYEQIKERIRKGREKHFKRGTVTPLKPSVLMGRDPMTEPAVIMGDPGRFSKYSPKQIYLRQIHGRRALRQ